MILVVSSPNAGGSLRLELNDTGRFTFKGLPDGLVSVRAFFHGKLQPLDYRLSPANRCLDPQIPTRLLGQLDRDIADLTILFEAGEQSQQDIPIVDAAVVADFNDAKAGPITGVPPGAYPPR